MRERENERERERMRERVRLRERARIFTICSLLLYLTSCFLSCDAQRFVLHFVFLSVNRCFALFIGRKFFLVLPYSTRWVVVCWLIWRLGAEKKKTWFEVEDFHFRYFDIRMKHCTLTMIKVESLLKLVKRCIDIKLRDNTKIRAWIRFVKNCPKMNFWMYQLLCLD